MEFRIGNKMVDLGKAFPITLGDTIAMDDLGFKNGAVTTPKMTAGMILHFARKVDPGIVEIDVYGIELSALEKIGKFIGDQLPKAGDVNPT